MPRQGRSHQTVTWAGAVFLTLAACGACVDFATDPEVGITLRTDRDVYIVGEAVTITLHNGYRGDVSYQLYWCGLELQQRVLEDGEWQWVWDPTRQGQLPCHYATRVLSPGEATSMEFSTDRPEITAPGSYRFRYGVDEGRGGPSPGGDKRIDIVSNSFEVVREEG